VPVNTSIGFHLPRNSVQVQSHGYHSFRSLNPVLGHGYPWGEPEGDRKRIPWKKYDQKRSSLPKESKARGFCGMTPFLIDSKKEGDVKPESLLSQRPSLYSIGAVVSMHPTVLSCSPMKDRWSFRGGSEFNGRRVENQRLRGKDNLCYPNVSKLLFLFTTAEG